jgi:hypothetical protein
LILYRAGGQCCQIDAGRIVDRADFCQSKIENLGVSAGRNEQVRGLDITMSNSGGMRRIQPIGDFDR